MLATYIVAICCSTVTPFLAKQAASPVQLCSEHPLARESESFHFGTCPPLYIEGCWVEELRPNQHENAARI